ncbi:Poly A RNA polymerase gld-2 [Taenia solium]|eukprot:TsM_000279700 transcript=TsM_000279700 gene=TsM_000279700
MTWNKVNVRKLVWGHSCTYSPATKSFTMSWIDPVVKYLDGLSAKIENFFQVNHQTTERYEEKVKLKDHICSIISQSYPNSKLVIVGSSAGGFGLNQSDLDLCLVLRPQKSQVESLLAVNTILSILFAVFTFLEFKGTCVLIPARMPIIRIQDEMSGTKCDLGVNGLSAIYNTHLICGFIAYSAF